MVYVHFAGRAVDVQGLCWYPDDRAGETADTSATAMAAALMDDDNLLAMARALAVEANGAIDDQEG